MTVRKSGLFLSVIMTGALVVSILTNIHLYIVSKQLHDELSELRLKEFEMHGYIYYLPGFPFENETREHAPTLWSKVKDFDEAKSVVSEKNFSVIVYMHPYQVGLFNPSTAEWIVIVSSIPEMTNEVKVAIFRLDYQTCDVKKAYGFGYPVADELTLEEGIAVITEEMTRDPIGSKNPVISERVKLLGGNYVYSYSPTDFGGTVIVNKYARIAIFYATTVWLGTGGLFIPED